MVLSPWPPWVMDMSDPISHQHHRAFLQIQWEIQVPKMELLYHIVDHILGGYLNLGLKNRPYI